jgi:two-component system, OmpR family, sensor kinase
MTFPGASHLGLRGRLLISVLIAIGLMLAALTVGFNVVLANRLDAAATGVVQARATAELAALRVDQGRIVLPEAPDDTAPDTQTWVFQGARALERPRSNRASNAAAAGLAGRPQATLNVAGTPTRLYSLPVVRGGHRLGTVVAGVSLLPYEQTRRTALLAAAALAVLAFAAVALTANWLISRALRPVARMTRQASQWSDRDLERRFGLGEPRDELTQLAFTLDGLLDRLVASLRHEQRLSAELSHELRTPLASIAAEAQFALRHTQQDADGRLVLENILASAAQMTRTIDTLIAAARAELNPRRATTEATSCVRSAIAACAPIGGIEPSIHEPAEPLRVAVEEGLLERILSPLIENACRHAVGHAAVNIERDGTTINFVILDDGAGVQAADRDEIFIPGRQATASPSTAVAAPGAGLGLALSRRLARSAGGDVTVEPSDHGGRFVVRLPAA